MKTLTTLGLIYQCIGIIVLLVGNFWFLPTYGANLNGLEAYFMGEAIMNICLVCLALGFTNILIGEYR